MLFKILLISTFILTFIGTNVGVNYTWEKDDQDSYFPSHDWAGGPPSPGEEMFRELFGTPVNQVDEEIHEETITAAVQNESRGEKGTEEWAQDIFVQEYQQIKTFKFWYDLRNESYVDSWPFLCYLLWDKNPNIKRGQECSATRMYEPLLPKYTYRVEIQNQYRYQVDLLQCKCPKNSRLPLKQQRVSYSGLYFFVTPCATFHNSYYIIKPSRPASLEVFDIRNTTFSSKFDGNLHAPEYEKNVQTYGQPGRKPITNQNELTDEESIQKSSWKSFMQDYACCTDKKMIWPDLRNKAYEQSWPTLCLLLTDRASTKTTEKKCKTTIFTEFHNSCMTHRVLHPNGSIKMYVDLLSCKCPKSAAFYVTKSYTVKNSYYIMRFVRPRAAELEVYNIRSVVFNPNSSNTQ